MPSPSDTSRDFLTVAGELALLAPETVRDLVREATVRNLSPSQLALQRGLLSAIQVDIVETLLRPNETVPGYEILSVIGHGGMGVVYRARQKNLDRIVALKTVLVSQMGDASAVQRFEQEALTVARLRHPNVVAAYDFGRHEGRLFFAMELVEGENLEELINRAGRLSEATAWVLARQAAAGLAHAHQHGVVHRDIKPANLMLVPPPEGFPLPPGVPMVKIADFGLAFLTAEAETRTRLTAVNSTVGSPHYIAPELLTGVAVDFRADIYSLGATVYHMLAGRPPFADLRLAQILAQKVSRASPTLAEEVTGVSAASAALVAMMMAQDPARRIGSYTELLQRIDAILPLMAEGTAATLGLAGGVPALMTSDTLAGRGTTKTLPMATAAPPRRKKWLPIALAAAILLSLVLGLMWKFWPTDASTTPARRKMEIARAAWLFNGQSIDGWTVRGGQWSMVEDQELGNVISGAGGLFRRTLPLDPAGQPSSGLDCRITASFRLHEAQAIEFHFGAHPAADDNGQRYVLRITREGATLGQRSGDRGDFVQRSAPLQISIDPAAIHGIELERQFRFWYAVLVTRQDERLVGVVPARDDGPESPEIRLAAEGESGPAFFFDIQSCELKPPAASAAKPE